MPCINNSFNDWFVIVRKLQSVFGDINRFKARQRGRSRSETVVRWTQFPKIEEMNAFSAFATFYNELLERVAMLNKYLRIHSEHVNARRTRDK